MLTQFRHIQKGALILVTIIIVFAFAFLYSDYDFAKGTLGSQDCVFKVYGKCYRLKEAQKLSNSLQVASQFGMYDFAMDLFGRGRMDADQSDFILSLVILRKEAKRLGIEPSFEEIQKEIPELPRLKSQPWMNEEIVKNILAANGFSTGDFQQLVGDYLSWKKLRELVSSGVESVPSEVDRLYKDQYQRYDVMVADFARAEYESKVELADEEIKKFYDENLEFLNSDPQRAFVMVRFIEGEQPEDATNEQRDIAALEFKKSVGKIYKELAENPGEFTKIAESKKNAVSVNQVEVKTIDIFSMDEIPEVLKEEQEVVQRIFSETLQEKSVTQPFELADGSAAVFQVSKINPPKPLSLEEARPIIVDELKREKSSKMANEAASEARQKVLDALKGGKSFADAAKEAGLKTRVVPNFSQSEPATGVEDAPVVGSAVRGVAAGELSAVMPKSGGAGYLLAFVDKITLYKDSSRESQENILAASQNRADDSDLFTAWFNQRKKEANAERDPRKRIIEGGS